MTKRTTPKPPCAEPGCDRPSSTRQWCDMHYKRLLKAGLLEPIVPPSEEERLAADVARFLSHVDVNGPTMPHMKTNCHVWTKSCQPRGYGQFVIRVNGRYQPVGAHRQGWIYFVGPISDEKPFVCHRCDNPPCVRLEHLFLGTHQDNMDDMFAKDRRTAAVGEKASKTKLTAEQVIEIRARHANGERMATLGREYGIAGWNISMIVQGRVWKHLL